MKITKALAIAGAVVCSVQGALAVEIPQSLTSRLSKLIPGYVSPGRLLDILEGRDSG